jgi:hypothetical protein
MLPRSGLIVSRQAAAWTTRGVTSAMIEDDRANNITSITRLNGA